jgi:phosphodiesterase/alkaline phosphatase D-like protein
MTDQLRYTPIPVRTESQEAPTPQTVARLAALRRRDLLGWMAAVIVLGSGRAAAPAASTTRLRMGVASCADQRQPQPIWDTVLAEPPDFFVFAGDNVYASEQPFDVATLRAAYLELAAKPNFAHSIGFRGKAPQPS